jgi:endonuclease/exonuclease/phosphatase family metal-dependent hydrolase
VAAELALPALTVVFGLQLLRLMVATTVSVYRERLGASLTSLALFAVGTILLGLLAGPVARLLGQRRALLLSAGGVALVRLVVQLVPDALVRWLLATVGVVLFLWFVPVWLGLGRAGAGGGLRLALLLGLAVDTALHGLHGSWDYAWSVTLWPVVLAALLAAALGALALVPTPGPPGPGVTAPGGRLVAVLPLAGIGPALFLHALVWQNLGWQAVVGGRSPPQVSCWSCWPTWPAWSPVRSPPRPGTTAWNFLGQAAAATLLVVLTRRATEPDREGPAHPGSGRTTFSFILGMLLFVLLVFGYYAAYDVVLPFDNRVLLLIAAVLLGLAGLGAAQSGRSRRGGPVPDGREPWPPGLAAVSVGVALLLAPAAFWASAPGPVGAEPDLGERSGPLVRVMSYNIHFGFDVEGWSDLEATARTIEASGAEVVGLQEVSRGWYVNGSTDMLAWLQRRLRMPHASFAGASDAIWGNAILSRYPIVDGGVALLPREGVPLRRSYLWVELDLGAEQRLRTVVSHLHHIQSPDGARVRQAEVPRLLDGVAGRSTTVVMGDLNAEPGSREMTMLRAAGLVGAFQAGGGTPPDEPTYSSDRRIDYIWLSPDLAASGFDATTGTASDHRGVVATVRPAA